MQIRLGKPAPTIVGYSSVDSGNKLAPTVAGVFFPVAGGNTYDLSMLAIPEKYDEDGELEDYADPNSEYLRVLDPMSSATTAQYCYVSKGFLLDNVDGSEEGDNDWAIGWWQYDGDVDYAELIEDHADTLKVKGTIPFAVGAAFLGKFDPTHTIALQSSGEVKNAPTAFATGNALAPLFANYLPVDIDLFDMAMPEKYDEDGELEDYADPNSEYLRVLDPMSSATTAQYCYVSKGFLLDNVDGSEEGDNDWAIGWWQYDGDVDYAELIEGHEDDLMIKTAIPVKSGSGFLGKFDPTHTQNIAFPSAFDVK